MTDSDRLREDVHHGDGLRRGAAPGGGGHYPAGDPPPLQRHLAEDAGCEGERNARTGVQSGLPVPRALQRGHHRLIQSVRALL